MLQPNLNNASNAFSLHKMLSQVFSPFSFLLFPRLNQLLRCNTFLRQNKPKRLKETSAVTLEPLAKFLYQRLILLLKKQKSNYLCS
jgi:hypothetical protein